MDMSAAELKRAAATDGKAPPQNQTPAELNGSEILVRCLQAEGVKYIWGYPGGAVLYIYDALYKQDSIEHVLVRHEQAAVHAADGYARATGNVGVALVTSGPGVTNAITGIATAYMDSIPMVIITGQVPTPAIGLDAFQECDTVGITRPIVKHNFLVKDVRDLARTIKKAFHIARTGRPGPVVVDIPKDVSLKTTTFEYPETVEMRSYNPVRKGHGGQIRKAVQLLMQAKRPYIYTGGGVILGNASAELRELVDLLGYPCTNTLMGLGAYPASDPKFLGMLGMHGTYEANMTMQNCDVLLAVGARFDDRVIGNPAHFASVARKIIHIDIDPSSISKRVKVDIPIVGDVKDVLQELIAQIKEQQLRPDTQALSAWWGQINEWRKRECLKYRHSDEVIKPQYVIETLWELTRDRETYITSDVGQHQMWAAQFYRFDEPRRWINSGGLGTMGVGLPYAMGIKLAKPEADVFCITGEGSIQMCIQELSTCQQYQTPVKIISLNNRYLGMVRQWQQLEYSGRYSHSYMDALPDFVKLAEAYGHVGLKIEKPSEVEPALREMMRLKDRTVFLDVRTDPTENVWPMVQAGKGITEMLLGSEDL
ncbi:acetolactate synthase 3 catalytic subunit [Caldimonas thermodepolymerans]|jgi:acetolactate synthase-1/2/3 large subunit|uniref:Acetolactate synthase n=1 Tax=Caldimonas thermodepolymerans TaxID=215580 RepID=A0A2S5T612_9BURK|nr:acetolactate synthase 3 catalytic subunit [Caldimonas thermodepolymerans]PPE70421.1 acetolactate synthase, large subunit, biosynthetic type [Caldimonas thermodepolymerans]QPC30328.1 acetolactate synthase 3 catalytic subunit [Caldimonas thermodepolymerans]RDI00728.1 acetolactate synthase large subunit [Caldimonas thermodepolymerans]TCP06993.1 acetolactate synthase large subunit [Caldimonas thermodepolymerans]UZG43091.1 acetolactate synthase 3 catalytic subunit [Caldimonas thermodepolymerans]